MIARYTVILAIGVVIGVAFRDLFVSFVAPRF